MLLHLEVHGPVVTATVRNWQEHPSVDLQKYSAVQEKKADRTEVLARSQLQVSRMGNRQWTLV